MDEEEEKKEAVAVEVVGGLKRGKLWWRRQGEGRWCGSRGGRKEEVRRDTRQWGRS
jgi:hypothetical protein